MNHVRRKWIEEVYQKLQDLQEEIDAICAEEQDAFDNLPESLQYSERADAMQDAIDSLEYASSNLGEALDCLTEAQG